MLGLQRGRLVIFKLDKDSPWCPGLNVFSSPSNPPPPIAGITVPLMYLGVEF